MAKLLARLSRALHRNKNTLPASSGIFEIGSVIEQRYRLDAEIGRGGMGIVYLAHDIPDDRDVAVKLIDRRTANDLSLQQFRREASIMASLNHPNIVALYRNGADNPIPFIVMELARGTPLSDMPTLTYATVVDIGKQVCNALEYIHNQGLVYRDIKPGNIILQKCGFHYSVKLLDFGLARPLAEAYLPEESSRAGTVFYLAPELITGGSAGIATDLYALGATLYEMITGRVPFSNIDEQTILSQHLEGSVAPPSRSRSDVPRALESIVLRLLEKNPLDRFASAQEVWAALEQVWINRVGASSGNLPAIALSGRENETEQIIQLLEANRLVTMLNDDETLATAVATQLADQFADGVWLIQLGSVTDPAAVLQMVAAVLDVHENPDRPLAGSLIESLREKKLLLLPSHCGHLRAACAQLFDMILRECPEVYVLAISHQPFKIALETCYGNQSV